LKEVYKGHVSRRGKGDACGYYTLAHMTHAH